MKQTDIRPFLKLRNILSIYLMLNLLFLSGCVSQFTCTLNGEGASIALITDVHISNDESKDNRLRNFINKVNAEEIKADMIVVNGDCVSSIFTDRNHDRTDERNNRLARFYEIMNTSQVPYFIVMGNHDYKIDSDKDSDAPFSKAEIDSAETVWENVSGVEPYYSTEYNEWKLVFMNSMRGRYLDRNFDNEQINWLENELDTEKPVLLFFHHPLKTDHFRIWCKPKDLVTTEVEADFFKLLKDNRDKIKGIFVGHGHMFVSDLLFDEIKVYETGSFADNEALTFSLISLDNINGQIKVKKIK